MKDEITIYEFIEQIRENTYEYDKKNRNLQSLAFVMFLQNGNTMQGILENVMLNNKIIDGATSSIVCNISLLLRTELSNQTIEKELIIAAAEQQDKIRSYNKDRSSKGRTYYRLWFEDHNYDKITAKISFRLKEFMIQIRKNVAEYDILHRTLEDLALITFMQNSFTMQGILANDIDLILEGATNAILCNFSILYKLGFTPHWIIGKLLLAERIQGLQIKQYINNGRTLQLNMMKRSSL